MLDNTDITPRFYAACLASYNNGVLHGAWIEASTDTDEMQEEIAAMLRASKFPNVTVDCPQCDGDGTVDALNADDMDPPTCTRCKGKGNVPSAEEWAAHDFDGLPSTLGEYCGLQAIADYMEFVEAVEETGTPDPVALAHAMLENWHSVEYAKEALENYMGMHDSFRDYADEQADELIACYTSDGKAPQMLVNYFDYASYARDLRLEMTVLDVASGVAVFND
tara:strand:+ start:1004 stop:1669 length:666 start_codon:yes stop_codon:yes gene_type:complete